MEAWQVALIVGVVLVVLVALAVVLAKRRGHSRFQRRFGPEYDRAVARHGSRQAAEEDLRERTRRHDELELRPLDDQARRGYQDEWQAVQRDFVDQPEASIARADLLLDRVMRDRGYPVDDFDEKADLVSVDHPQVVEDYRAARTVKDRSASGLASTDELRQALLRYRSLFDELLGDGRATGPDGTRSERR